MKYILLMSGTKAGVDSYHTWSRADAEALVAKAHQVCPYSNATRNNVDVRLTVV